MVASLGRSAGVIGAVLMCATAAVAQNRVNGPDQEIVIQLHRLNHDEMTVARMGQDKGSDPKVRELASHMLKAHEGVDRLLLAYAERKDMNMSSVVQAADAQAYGPLALIDLTSAARGVEFDWVVTAQQSKRYKPNPRGFELMFERVGLPPTRILHVAQSLYHEHVPAQRLGLSTVWVDRRGDRPGSGATPPADATPDLTVPDMATLASLAAPA